MSWTHCLAIQHATKRLAGPPFTRGSRGYAAAQPMFFLIIKKSDSQLLYIQESPKSAARAAYFRVRLFNYLSLFSAASFFRLKHANLPNKTSGTSNIHLCTSKTTSFIMNSMKLVIPLHSLYWSIHTKDESKRGTAFAFIFGVN